MSDFFGFHKPFVNDKLTVSYITLSPLPSLSELQSLLRFSCDLNLVFFPFLGGQNIYPASIPFHTIRGIHLARTSLLLRDYSVDHAERDVKATVRMPSKTC